MGWNTGYDNAKRTGNLPVAIPAKRRIKKPASKSGKEVKKVDINIKAEPKEIAALVVAIQERPRRITVADFEKEITESINRLAQDESRRLGLTL